MGFFCNVLYIQDIEAGKGSNSQFNDIRIEKIKILLYVEFSAQGRFIVKTILFEQWLMNRLIGAWRNNWIHLGKINDLRLKYLQKTSRRL